MRENKRLSYIILGLSALYIIGAVAILTLITGCLVAKIGPSEDKWVIGTLAKIERATDYEAPCSLRARLAKACEEPPVCCAYEATVVDSVGKEYMFFMFAPKGNKIPTIGTYAMWHLHLGQVFDFSRASGYAQPYVIAYMLTKDSDVRRLQ